MERSGVHSKELPLRKLMEPISVDESPPEISEQQIAELLGEVRHQTILHWNYRRLKVLPKKVLEECSHILQIYLKRNLLKYIPDSIGCLSQLTYCYLHGNNLHSLPDSFGELVSLQVLDVGNNKIKYLPASLGKLPSLRSLVAVYNEISSFPEELCNLKTLSVLMLSGNSLSHLPEAIGGLTGLQGFYVDHNHLKELPRSLAYLPLLTIISCCCNELTYLPALTFSSNPTVFFDDNPQLNYLPFSVMRDLRSGESWDPVILKTCGCFQDDAIVDNSVFISTSKFYRNDWSNCLLLPAQINRASLSPEGFSTSSLFELCLRYLWEENQKRLDIGEGRKSIANMKFSHLPLGSIPSNIYNLLQIGPVTYCSYANCTTPIFTDCSATVIKVSVTQRVAIRGITVPSVLYFCCDSCRSYQLQYVKSMTDTFSLWLGRQMEHACTVKLLR